jgi:hypothetical protein
MTLRRWAITAAVTVAGAAGLFSPVLAEPPAGSKNFNPPAVVPNYFSNESGPVMRNPAPLPIAPPAQTGAAPAIGQPPLPSAAPAAAPAPAVASERSVDRRTATAVKSRDRDRTAQAKTRTADKRKGAVARARSTKPARVAVRNDKPRTTKLAHAEPRPAKARPAAAKGQHTGTAGGRAARG